MIERDSFLNAQIVGQKKDERERKREKVLFAEDIEGKGASLLAQIVKNLSATWETWVWSLGWADPLVKGKATSRVFLPGEFYGQRSLSVAKSRTQPSDWHFHFFSLSLKEKPENSQKKNLRHIHFPTPTSITHTPSKQIHELAKTSALW